MTKEELLALVEQEGNEYKFTYKRHQCLLSRVPALGTWCGYVCYKGELPRGFIKTIRCHGGITFNKHGIIGFDCAHGFDIRPHDYDGVESPFKKYRTLEYARKECEEIVEQIIAFQKPRYNIIKVLRRKKPPQSS